MAEPLFTITVVHEVNLRSPAVAQAVLGALQQLSAAQAASENRIMGALEDLQTRFGALETANAELRTQVEEGNTKTDALIASMQQLVVSAMATKDALVAARDEIARLQTQQGAATAADLVALTARIDAVITATNDTLASVNAQDAETDAAANAAGNASTAVAP